MIKVRNLTRRYGSQVAVSALSFDVAPNEVVGFLGPNGAGKSTTLRVLAGLHVAEQGSATISGVDLFAYPDRVKSMVGYLPESAPLYPEMRVCEYLTYRAAIKGIPGKRRLQMVMQVVSSCGLDESLNRIIGQLSKGTRQRVGLADALIGDPRVLILDEPSVGLDPAQIRQMRDLIRDQGKARTVILSSHILHEVEAVCDRVIIINRGKMVTQGRPDELRRDILGGQGVLNLTLEGALSVVKKALAPLGELTVEQEEKGDVILAKLTCDQPEKSAAKVFDTAVANGFRILAMTPQKQDLEVLFMALTREGAADE